MNLLLLRVAVLLLPLLLARGAAVAREPGETREEIGAFRFALRDLPPLIDPVPGTHAYLVNGRSEGWYRDGGFAPGTVRTEVNYLPGSGPRDRADRVTTYRLLRIHDAPRGQPPTRRRWHLLVGDKFSVILYFASGDAYRQPTRADLQKAFGRHIVFGDDEKRR